MPTWYPGQVAVGDKVFADQVIFAGVNPPVFQKGIFSIPPVITTPSTVPSPGTVTNTTGYDVMVYAAATTGIGSVKFASQGGSLTPGSTVSPSGQVTDFYLAAGQTVALTYTGTLTWLWLAV